jgi:hypothetical protein
MLPQLTRQTPVPVRLQSAGADRGVRAQVAEPAGHAEAVLETPNPSSTDRAANKLMMRRVSLDISFWWRFAGLLPKVTAPKRNGYRHAQHPCATH